ncbi:VrrA/YqfQ family protein [Oceanobacillus chungangensis]|uniref:YqfQ-like protein n=1 Tax=Oceanobacillus chungangensis TaxID=1229152 RepID=A0A3D8Q0W7_9BACI|nr:VrrA/YqfQ family protein [Oceanobacillus chungangensis]RDW22086.1 hypothetical protein CWR45_00945 [Oceanobacillus chungangensis]
MFPGNRQRNGYSMPMHRGMNNFRIPNQGFNQQPQRSMGANLLQRFLPQQAQAATIASKGAGGLSNTLNNVQQVLKVVQSTAPLVQEYGPMVKNLPAMYRMMKAFKNLDLTEDSAEDKAEADIEDQTNPSNNTKNTDTIRKIPTKKGNGNSKPKLYI